MSGLELRPGNKKGEPRNRLASDRLKFDTYYNLRAQKRDAGSNSVFMAFGVVLVLLVLNQTQHPFGTFCFVESNPSDSSSAS